MGGEVFTTRARGETAQEAFDAAKEEAFYDHGHSGYTGTIAEKPGFTIIPLPDANLSDPEAYADELIRDNDERIEGKWENATAFQVGPKEWLFFGWASS